MYIKTSLCFWFSWGQWEWWQPWRTGEVSNDVWPCEQFFFFFFWFWDNLSCMVEITFFSNKAIYILALVSTIPLNRQTFSVHSTSCEVGKSNIKPTTLWPYYNCLILIVCFCSGKNLCVWLTSPLLQTKLSIWSWLTVTLRPQHHGFESKWK